MKPTKEQIEAYKEMAKTSPDNMRAMIEENLKATCDKYAGHEDRLDDCIEYLTACAKEILGGKNGEVDNETCYRICRDYFNDELWAKEDEEKAEREAKLAKAKKAKNKTEKTEKKAKKKTEEPKKEPEQAKNKTEKTEKKAKKKAEKKTAAQVEKESLEEENKRIEQLRVKHGLKAEKKAEEPKKEPEQAPVEMTEKTPETPKFQMCPVCGKEFLILYHGMCLKCYEKRPMQAEKPAQAQTAQIQPEQGQLDLFAAMGV